YYKKAKQVRVKSVNISDTPTIRFHDGNEIPQIGFGTFLIPEAETEQAVADALHVGYRHIDTAAVYRNEEGVGKAIANSGLKRSEIFVTTKLANADQGADTTIPAFEESLEKLGLEQVDLYLIHWPGQDSKRRLATWEKFQEIKASGRARSIGVSNF